jgi:pilus assembly protein CpaC
LDNREIKSMSEVPFLSRIPVLGNLFKSKSFQKNETELMFIVTAQLVKPMNRDDIPPMRGMDGLKKGSPLGLEPTGEGIQGPTGHSIPGQKSQAAPVAAPTTSDSPKAEDSKSKAVETSAGSTTSSNANRRVNPALPEVKTLALDYSPEPFRP